MVNQFSICYDTPLKNHEKAQQVLAIMQFYKREVPIFCKVTIKFWIIFNIMIENYKISDKKFQ